MANKKVRIIVAVNIGSVLYKPNDVVNLPDVLAKQHAEAVDPNKEAVAYALSINGGKVIEHAAPEPEAPVTEPPAPPAPPTEPPLE